jgi:hypothetical protein
MRDVKRNLSSLLLAIGLAVGTSGCSACTDFNDYTFGPDVDGGGADSGGVDGGGVDGGGVDGGGVDGGGVDGGGVPTGPTGVVQTSGSAVIEGSGYRLRISVGAPQPMGEAEGGGNRLVVGPEGL